MRKIHQENIPTQLQAIPQWVCWKGEHKKEGRMTKVPINPNTGKKARVNDSNTWSTYDDAKSCCIKNHLDGLGFVFSADDNFIGIDLDHSIDSNTGEIEEKAQSIIKQFDSYTEISPSGNGVHILIKGKLPNGGKKSSNIEIYDKLRFFTVTGHILNGSKKDIFDRSDRLHHFFQTCFPESSVSPAKNKSNISEIIENACSAKNGKKFKALWEGNHFEYHTQSEADLALCKLLAFNTNNDTEKIDACFRKSGLFRSKWDEIHFANGQTYGEKTIQKAIDSTSTTYSPTVQIESQDNFKEFNLTDTGNAERLIYHYGEDIRYCHAWEKWLIWDGVRWTVDRTDKIKQLAKKVVRKIYSEAEKTADSAKRKAIASHAMKSESGNRIKAMISLAKSEVPITPEQLDQNPWLLTCINGTIDLKTGEKMKNQRSHFITQLVPVEFDKDLPCSKWHSFLDRIMGGNDNLISFLQRAVGYSLTGENTEQCMFILYGFGANGKSTFLQTLNFILGDYSKQTPTETLLVKQKGAIPNDVARLKGARFVTASEAESGQKFAESLIKQMTGGDTISARFLHQEWFDFQPTHKVFLGTNHKPVIKGTDHAIWRRIKLVPFEITIPENERDRFLLDKLREESAGILAWAVRGCCEWQKKGLGIPDEVKEATETYRGEMDALAEFLKDCCITGSSFKVSSRDLYEAYTAWCERNGEDHLKQRPFASQMKEKGFEQVRIGINRNRGWNGLGLLT